MVYVERWRHKMSENISNQIILDLLSEAMVSGTSVLGLSGLQITNLPREIGKLTKLTALYLSGCGFTTLPDELWQLKNLTELDLSSNQLMDKSNKHRTNCGVAIAV